MERVLVLHRQVDSFTALADFEAAARRALGYENAACSPLHAQGYVAFRLGVLRLLLRRGGAGEDVPRSTTFLTQQLCVSCERADGALHLRVETLLPVAAGETGADPPQEAASGRAAKAARRGSDVLAAQTPRGGEM